MIRLSRRSFLPRLEHLEDRTVPSTLTVSTSLASGPGSLNAVLAGAQNGDTITFAASLNGKAIPANLAITKSITILGPGAAKLALDGGGAHQILSVGAGATVLVSGLTLQHGVFANGGAVANNGNLTLTNDTLVANQAVASNGTGGAIFNTATLTVNHCVLLSNRAGSTDSAGHGIPGLGGALYNLGTAQLTGCTFQNDQVVGGFVGIAGAVGGGAICNAGQLVVSGCTFTNNIANGSGFQSTAQGGAIFNEGWIGVDGAPPFSASATITHSTFTGNQALGGAGAAAAGGAIMNQGDMALTNCVLAGNRALGASATAAASFDGQAQGGGIMNLAGTLTVTSCTLRGNQAVGGANNMPTEDQLSQLPAATDGAGQGGGICNAGGNATVVSVNFINNVAHGGDGSAGAMGTGGAIENTGISNGEAPSVDGASLNVIACTFTGNEAVGGSNSVDPIITSSNSIDSNGFGAGGALDDSLQSTATVRNSVFTGNAAIGGGGMVDGAGQPGIGGAIAVRFATLFTGGATTPTTLTLVGSTLTGNVALGGAAGPEPVWDPPGPGIPWTPPPVNGNGGNGLGGALAVLAGAEASLSRTRIENNYARGGAVGFFTGLPGEGIGGGTYSDLANASAVDAASLVAQNHATNGTNVALAGAGTGQSAPPEPPHGSGTA